jgi:hypothetical protein
VSGEKERRKNNPQIAQKKNSHKKAQKAQKYFATKALRRKELKSEEVKIFSHEWTRIGTNK